MMPKQPKKLFARAITCKIKFFLFMAHSISHRQLLRKGAFLAAGLPFARSFLEKIQVRPPAGILVGVNVSGVHPTQASTSGQVRPADKSVGLQWAELPLTAADPVKFKTWLAGRMETLEAAGVRLTAFELGNEINGPYFNGDFLPAQASGRVLGISDLNNPDDPEGCAIAASYRAYLQILKVLKDLRDQSKLNQTTPVLSAGLANGGLPGKKPGKLALKPI
jgi:hypothetical protein